MKCQLTSTTSITTFANYLGLELYDRITEFADSQNSGLGDWFFRQVAFPDETNNTGVYLSRYFPYHTEQTNTLKSRIVEKRHGLDRFMDGLVSKYALDHAQLVGFTSMFMQNAAVFSMARKLKARDYKPFLNKLAENFPQNNIEPILLFETSRGRCFSGSVE